MVILRKETKNGVTWGLIDQGWINMSYVTTSGLSSSSEGGSVYSVGGTVVYPGKSASGTGWAWENGTLTLTEDYSGGPIQAAGGLELHTTGNVTITGENGPAISAKSKVILWTD